MRLFVAIDIDPGVARQVAAFAGELRQRAQAFAPRARISWVPLDRLHVTVRFLGEVDDRRALAVAEALAPNLTTRAFELIVDGAGAFPPSGAPRVLWVGLTAGVSGLIDLETEVSDRLSGCGLPRDNRAYRPHLTLARVREPSSLRSASLLEGLADRKFGPTPVDAITLFQSQTSPRGPIYVPLQRTPLRA